MNNVSDFEHHENDSEPNGSHLIGLSNIENYDAEDLDQVFINTIRYFHEQGLSASQIAEMFDDTTEQEIRDILNT